MIFLKNSIFKGKNSEPKINLDISVEEILIFLLGNIIEYSHLNFFLFYLSVVIAWKLSNFDPAHFKWFVIYIPK